MNDDRSSSSSCYFHPKERLTGVCHVCLNERLLVLAAKQQLVSRSQSQSQRSSSSSYSTYRSLSLRNYSKKKKKTPQIKLPKIFAFGSSFLGRFDSSRHRHSEGDDDDVASSATTSSPDQDSFISIKFEDNGVASWDKGNNVSKVSLDHCNITWNNNHHKASKLDTTTANYNNKEAKSVIKHADTPRGNSIRWRKRIGHMFQLIRWKRSSSNKGGCGHSNNKMDGVKVRSNGNGYGNGWIRTLTMRRTKE